MKYKYVFILGRPGCGKSALFRKLEQRLLANGQVKSFARVDDFPKLWAKLKADDALEAEGKERVYMQVSFETCWARIVARHKATIDAGGDVHLVPREAMEKIYLQDDQEAFVRYMQDRNIPVVVVNNEADGEEPLKQQVEELFENLF